MDVVFTTYEVFQDIEIKIQAMKALIQVSWLYEATMTLFVLERDDQSESN